MRQEKDALEQLLSPPQIPRVEPSKIIDKSLLSEEELRFLERLQSTSSTSGVDTRMRSLYGRLEPTLDMFADQVLKVAQYRDAADSVASRVLAIAAEKLAERDKASRKTAKSAEGGVSLSPRRDLGNVLRGLSRADR